MKTQKQFNSVLKQAFLVSVIGLITVPVAAEESARKPMDPKSPNPFAKLVGEISQLPSSGGNLVGNAFVVGRDGCNILTNFHVAFGKTKDAEGNVTLFEKTEVGHTVTFSLDLDSKTGKFKRQMKAKVIEYGNYQSGTTRGFLGDVAVLQLESCLGKEYAGPELDRPEPTKRSPTGKLTTVSTSRDESGKNQILIQEGCRAENTPVTGMLVSNCEIVPGMSGSMVLEEGDDGKQRLVGLNVQHNFFRDGRKVAVGIYSKVLTKFLDGALGEMPVDVTPLATRERPPQSDASAQTASLKPRTTVR